MTSSKEERESLYGKPEWSRGRAKTEVMMPKPSPLIAMLVVVDPSPGHVFRLDPESPSTIGRDYSSDIIVDEPSVSRQHAKLRAESDENGVIYFQIWDLATENGTEVNGKPIVKHRLQDGDRIRIGRVTMVYKFAYRE